MNSVNNYPVAKFYESRFCQDYFIEHPLTVEVFKRDYQSTEPYSQTTHHACWGSIFTQAINIDNMEIIKYIFSICGNQILTHKINVVPLCYAATAKTAQLLINLGADVNIDYPSSPLYNYLAFNSWNMHEPTKHYKIDVIKCFIRNGAVIDKRQTVGVEFIALAQEEIAKENSELVSKGILFASLMKDEKSILTKIQMPHDVVNLIIQKMIDKMISF